MPPRFQSPPSLVAPIAIAVFGVAYCLFVYLGVGESVCVTAGCSLYKTFTLFGVSMWIFGMVAFVFLTLLMAAGAYTLSLFFARLCILGDCVLLLVMATTSPCLSCLGVALLFALTYFLLRHADPNENRGSSSLLFLWSLLFVSNLVLSAREMLPPEPIYGTSDAPVHIYFSPTCENCLAAMDKFNFGDGQVAYFATSRGDEDLSMLIALSERLNAGQSMPDALRAVKANASERPEFVWSKDNLLLQWQLLRNKATVIERSGGSVPYITINGLPVSGANPEVVPGENLKEVYVAPEPSEEPQAQTGGNARPRDSQPGDLPDLRNEINLGRADDADSASSDVSGGEDGFLFGNTTSFATCSDEDPENCD